MSVRVHGDGMNEQPIIDKVAVAAGTLAASAISMQWVDTILALIVGLMTAMLLGMRIYLSWREIRTGGKPPVG